MTTECRRTDRGLVIAGAEVDTGLEESVVAAVKRALCR